MGQWGNSYPILLQPSQDCSLVEDDTGTAPRSAVLQPRGIPGPSCQPVIRKNLQVIVL